MKKRIGLALIAVIIALSFIIGFTSCSPCHANVGEPISEGDWIGYFYIDNSSGDTLHGYLTSDSTIYLHELESNINWTQSGKVSKIPD